MKKCFTIYSLAGALAFLCVLTALPALAQGRGGGGEEAAGNNLSIPAMFLPDTSAGPALRVPCGTYAAPGDDGVPSSTAFPGYWLQQTAATWSADCTTSSAADVIADWGDNLTTGPNLAAGKPIRVEVNLLDPTATGMRGFFVTNLTPDLPDRQSTYGTRGAPADAFVTGDANTPLTRVFDTGATLTIEELQNGTPVSPPIFDGPITAEVNATGGIVYGYNWGSKGRKNTPQPGTYRLTFRTVAATITDIADKGALREPTFDATSTSLIVTLTSANRGKGGGQGGGQGNGNGPPG